MRLGIQIAGQNLLASLKSFFHALLSLENIDALLVPQRLPLKGTIRPTLVTDPESLGDVDPLAPCFPFNSAKILSSLTWRPMGGMLAAVLRSCEIRAFVELQKLKQGSADGLLLVGLDCPGAFQNNDYLDFARSNGPESTITYLRHTLPLSDKTPGGPPLSPACLACEYPIPSGADILIEIYGADWEKCLPTVGLTAKGQDVLRALGLPAMEASATRDHVLESLAQRREKYREEMYLTVGQATSTWEKLAEYLAECVNCHNCRVACPVCYCRECVFTTDVFRHEPFQYLQWARRKGLIKMPTDTIFYHLTRLAHMSLACIGCGQCSNACPNHIPVMELVRLVARRTQTTFGYEAGRDPNEPPPLSVFSESEFPEAIGHHLPGGAGHV